MKSFKRLSSTSTTLQESMLPETAEVVYPINDHIPISPRASHSCQILCMKTDVDHNASVDMTALGIQALDLNSDDDNKVPQT